MTNFINIDENMYKTNGIIKKLDNADYVWNASCRSKNGVDVNLNVIMGFETKINSNTDIESVIGITSNVRDLNNNDNNFEFAIKVRNKNIHTELNGYTILEKGIDKYFDNSIPKVNDKLSIVVDISKVWFY